MTQQTINTGSAANDGTGDPLRTSFVKTNSNFDELYARPVASPSTVLPLIDATPAVIGTSLLYSRQDHVHPTDTSRAAVTYTDTQDALRVLKAGDTMTGDLTISKAGPSLWIDKTASGQAAQIIGRTNGVARWTLALGDTNAESSGNAGSDFTISSYNDAGTILATPMSITRSSGRVTLAGVLASNGHQVGANATPGFGNAVVGFAVNTTSTTFHSSAGASGSFNTNADGQNVAFCRSGTVVGSITVTTTATAYNTSSDERLKEDLQAFDAGSIVDDTKVFSFKWRSTGERSYGVIAQQANEVYPAAVFHDEKSDWWGIDYSKYTPIILQELQSLRARVAELEAKLASKPV